MTQDASAPVVGPRLSHDVTSRDYKKKQKRTNPGATGMETDTNSIDTNSTTEVIHKVYLKRDEPASAQDDVLLCSKHNVGNKNGMGNCGRAGYEPRT